MHFNRLFYALKYYTTTYHSQHWTLWVSTRLCQTKKLMFLSHLKIKSINKIVLHCFSCSSFDVIFAILTFPVTAASFYTNGSACKYSWKSFPTWKPIIPWKMYQPVMHKRLETNLLLIKKSHCYSCTGISFCSFL